MPTPETRVAVVTGASQGLGAGIAAGYRARGYKIVASSRTIAPSDDPDFLTVVGDIGEPSVAKQIIEQALDTFGRVDTLVNNAGVFIGSAFTEYTDEQYRTILRTNLDGFFYTTQHAIRAMERQGAGHVVQVVTTLAEHANVDFPSVLASLTKGGLAAATRSLATEYAARGIRVNAVSPGIIKTPMHPAKTHAGLAGYHPMQRMGEVDDIVQAVLYLEDAKFVTGEILHVDGGQVAGH